MADTNTPSVKKLYDYAQEQVDEQAILDKYNAATTAQFAAQREQNRQNENAFYNQMYNTQKTAMDTIRQSNAAAVSSGASRGIQAANELSALLGLQQESTQAATELANANRQTAQEETAAVLENVLNAYEQATKERQQLVQQGIEAKSVDVQQEANQAQATQAAQTTRDAAQSAVETGTSNYLAELAAQGKDYTTYSTEGAASLNAALDSIIPTVAGKDATALFVKDDWAGVGKTGRDKAFNAANNLKQIIKTYGLNSKDYADEIKAFQTMAEQSVAWFDFGKGGKQGVANAVNGIYNDIITRMFNEYNNKANTTKA